MIGPFSSGLMTECLKLSGKEPDERDRLMMLVMTGERTDMHCFMRGVGIGSRSQNLSGDARMTLVTSSLVTGWKSKILVAVVRQQSWVADTRPQYAHIRISTGHRDMHSSSFPGCKYDTQYSDGNETNVYNVTWSYVAGAKWPTPPKSCTKCGPKTAKKPY